MARSTTNTRKYVAFIVVALLLIPNKLSAQSIYDYFPIAPTLETMTLDQILDYQKIRNDNCNSITRYIQKYYQGKHFVPHYCNKNYIEYEDARMYCLNLTFDQRPKEFCKSKFPNGKWYRGTFD